MGASQEKFLSPSWYSLPICPIGIWYSLEPLAFSLICRNFTLRRIPCSLLVMLEISLTEACTGYEGAYTELRTLLNTLTYRAVFPISLLHKLLFACQLNEASGVPWPPSQCCVCEKGRDKFESLECDWLYNICFTNFWKKSQILISYCFRDNIITRFRKLESLLCFSGSALINLSWESKKYEKKKRKTKTFQFHDISRN